MHTLIQLLSQYELLETTAKYISAVDLYHTVLTCRDLYFLISQSGNTFNRLKAVTLCDGSGLRARQNYRGRYNGLRGSGALNWGPRVYPCYAKEEDEIRLWSLKCDSANTRRCLKCQIPICKECRYIPRVRDHDGYDPSRRPHFNDRYQCEDVIVYCEHCDPAVEEKTDHDFCNCDRYERWICLKCVDQEDEEDSKYHKHCREQTNLAPRFNEEGEDLFDSGMVHPDHQNERIVGGRSLMLLFAMLTDNSVLVSLW